jgi:hypothetical protein
MAVDRSPAIRAGVRRPRTLDAAWAAALRDAWRALAVTRVIVLVAGGVAVALWGLSGRVDGFDPASLTHGFGAVGDPVTATFARWDSVWYLAIAHDGYGADPARAAFFPLYPLLVRGGGAVLGSDIAAGVLVSLACFGAALAVLWRLTALEMDAPAARGAVWVMALFPMSFFFGAVYSESLYLLLSLGAFWAARRGRWAWAGTLGALAAGSRSTGLVLLVGLLLLGVRRGDRRRWTVDRGVAWLALVPVGVLVFCAALAIDGGSFTAPLQAQGLWMRSFAWPLAGVWDGTVAAWDGARQLLSGSRAPVYFPVAADDPFSVARINLLLWAFLVAAVPAVVGALRRLPLAYGAYAVCGLALPLSYPVAPQPLMSLPRFEAVLFPLAMWAGWWLTRPRRARLVRPAAAVAGALALAGCTAQFATWHWIA